MLTYSSTASPSRIPQRILSSVPRAVLARPGSHHQDSNEPSMILDDSGTPRPAEFKPSIRSASLNLYPEMFKASAAPGRYSSEIL